MEMTDAQRLIIFMLAEIYEHLGLEGVDPNLIREAIHSDNTWGISMAYDGLRFEETDTPPHVQGVMQAMEMWRHLERIFEQYSEGEQRDILQRSNQSRETLLFPGFDGNNETEHISAATFLIDNLGLFHRFRGRDLNAGYPCMTRYRRMLPAYTEVLRSDRGLEGMTPEDMVNILNA